MAYAGSVNVCMADPLAVAGALSVMIEPDREATMVPTGTLGPETVAHRSEASPPVTVAVVPPAIVVTLSVVVVASGTLTAVQLVLATAV